MINLKTVIMFALETQWRCYWHRRLRSFFFSGNKHDSIETWHNV